MQNQFMNLEASGLSQEELERSIINSIKGGDGNGAAVDRERELLESIMSNLDP